MMAHVVKCTICGERFDRDIELYSPTSTTRYAHAHCALDKWEKEGKKGEKPVIYDPKNFVRCMYCKGYINLQTDEYVHPTENLYAHKACQDKEDARPKSDREKLELYIASLFGLDFCPPAIQKQINHYIDEIGYTASGIQKTLEYYYKVKQKPITRKDTIAIIQYYYGEARNYYYKIYKSKIYNEKRNMNSYKPQEQKISISPPERTTINHKKLFTFLDEEGDDDI